MNDVAAVPGPIRLWPGLALAALIVVAKLIVPAVAPQVRPFGVLGGPLLALAIGIWWLLFSRVAWIERLGALILIGATMFAIFPALHVSIRTEMMGYMFVVYVTPIVGLALVAWAAIAGRLTVPARRAALAAMILIAIGAWTLVRTEGFSGDLDQDFALRWTKTREERLLARPSDEPPPPPVAAPSVPVVDAPALSAPASASASVSTSAPATAPAASVTPGAPAPAPVAASIAPPAWPGFRGPNRDGVVRGVTIAADWTTSPPAEVWRRPVGPGWSSFAVDGDRIYTQEQRGGDEIVSAYAVATGQPVWRHHDTARFWESNGGAGPRATPTLGGGRVYALGATGLLNALDARTGALVWSHNAAADTGAKIPDWGFSGSPLLVSDLVIAATGGILVAYDAASGARRWVGPATDEGYSSPLLTVIDGVPQVLHMSGTGLTSVAPADGAVLWQHQWSGYPIVQPSLVPDGGVLIAANESSGTRRLHVSRGAGGWTVDERWTSNGLKPWYNDFVVHKGYAFGFDGTILSCIDLADGTRKWKGGRYGGGQLVLIADQDLLLVVSEEGELVLVSATPDQFREVARARGISGKTWNHPVIAGGLLFVRNGEEMAAFRVK